MKEFFHAKAQRKTRKGAKVIGTLLCVFFFFAVPCDFA